MKHMKRVWISIIVLTIVSLMADAQVKRHEVKLGDFSRLALIDNVNVNYRCNADSAGMAVFHCAQEVANHLIFNLSKNGRLTIQVDNMYEQLPNLPAITVYSSSLDEAENGGDSTLRVSGLPPLKAFKVRNTDNGKVIVRGIRASQLELQILSGKGKIIADGSCDNLSLRLIGTGEI